MRSLCALVNTHSWAFTCNQLSQNILSQNILSQNILLQNLKKPNITGQEKWLKNWELVLLHAHNIMGNG